MLCCEIEQPFRLADIREGYASVFANARAKTIAATDGFAKVIADAASPWLAGATSGRPSGAHTSNARPRG